MGEEKLYQALMRVFNTPGNGIYAVACLVRKCKKPEAKIAVLEFKLLHKEGLVDEATRPTEEVCALVFKYLPAKEPRINEPKDDEN